MNKEFVLLDAPKKCEWTGKMYDAVRLVECACDCHKSDVAMMHFIECCNNGYVEEKRYVEIEETDEYKAWKYLAKLAHNQYSHFDGCIDQEGFIETGMDLFSLTPKIKIEEMPNLGF